MARSDPRLPVTVLPGYLGAGKTTLLNRVLNGPIPRVVRAKGHFWIAKRPDWMMEFPLAGALSTLGPFGPWWSSVPPERRPVLSTRLDAVPLPGAVASDLDDVADMADPYPVWRRAEAAA